MPIRRSTADKLKKPLLYLVVCIILLCGTMYYYNKGETSAPGFSDWADDYSADGLEVHFIDVGQGDCTLLLCGDAAVLVDGGEYENGRSIVNYCKHHGVEKLDLLVATHRHSDHIGGLSVVIEQMQVDEVLINRTDESHNIDSYDYSELNYDLIMNNITVTVAENSSVYQFDELLLEVMTGIADSDDENESGIILRCVYEESSVLLTGDIGEEAERKLLAENAALDCDLLKVAHHGSKNSSCADFLDAVTPQISVVSCGEDNLYGHPNEETLQRLQNVNSIIYRTDQAGTIAFSCKNNTIEIISDGKEE